MILRTFIVAHFFCQNFSGEVYRSECRCPVGPNPIIIVRNDTPTTPTIIIIKLECRREAHKKQRSRGLWAHITTQESTPRTSCWRHG